MQSQGTVSGKNRRIESAQSIKGGSGTTHMAASPDIQIAYHPQAAWTSTVQCETFAFWGQLEKSQVPGLSTWWRSQIDGIHQRCVDTNPIQVLIMWIFIDSVNIW